MQQKRLTAEQRQRIIDYWEADTGITPKFAVCRNCGVELFGQIWADDWYHPNVLDPEDQASDPDYMPSSAGFDGRVHGGLWGGCTDAKPGEPVPPESAAVKQDLLELFETLGV